MNVKCTKCEKVKYGISKRTYRRKTRDEKPYICCKCGQEARIK